jgi:hypothetical protein
MWRTASGLREIKRGGGPAAARVRGVHPPTGWILPASRIEVEVEARDGRTVEIEPELPVPLPWALGYRLARRAGVPVIADVEPESLRFGVPLPWRRS